MKQYQLNKLTYTPPVNLDIVSKTMGDMQKGRLAAIEAKGNLMGTIQNLPLDESEQGYLNGIADQYAYEIQDATLNGDMYYATNKIAELTSRLKTDPELNAKIKYNKERETWKQSILNDKKVDNDTKEYLLNNPANAYNYQNNYKKDKDGNIILDENGKPIIIGGNSFQAGVTPTEQYSLTDTLVAALKLAHPDSYQGNSITFIDGNGNQHSKYQFGDSVLNTFTGAKEELTPEKIKNMVYALFDSDPKYYRSIEQEMNVQDYASRRDGQATKAIRPDLYTDDNGNLKTIGQYLEDKIDRFSRAAAWRDIKNSSSYRTGSISTSSQSDDFGEIETGNGNIGFGNSPYNPLFGGNPVSAHQSKVEVTVKNSQIINASQQAEAKGNAESINYIKGL